MLVAPILVGVVAAFMGATPNDTTNQEKAESPLQEHCREKEQMFRIAFGPDDFSNSDLRALVVECSGATFVAGCRTLASGQMEVPGLNADETSRLGTECDHSMIEESQDPLRAACRAVLDEYRRGNDLLIVDDTLDSARSSIEGVSLHAGHMFDVARNVDPPAGVSLERWTEVIDSAELAIDTLTTTATEAFATADPRSKGTDFLNSALPTDQDLDAFETFDTTVGHQCLV